LESSLTKVLSGIESQDSLLAEIKTASTAPAPVSEKVDLTTVEQSLSTMLTKIDSIPVPEKTDLSTLEKSVNDVLATTTSHKDSLAQIQAAVSAPAAIAEKTDLTLLETSVKTIIADLDSQKKALSAIQKSTSTPAEKADFTGLESSIKTAINSIDSQKDILSEVKADISASKVAVIEKVESVKVSVEAIPAPAPTVATKDTEILEEVKVVRTLLEKHQSTSQVVEIEDKGIEVPKAVKSEGNGVKAEPEAVEA